MMCVRVLCRLFCSACLIIFVLLVIRDCGYWLCSLSELDVLFTILWFLCVRHAMDHVHMSLHSMLCLCVLCMICCMLLTVVVVFRFVLEYILCAYACPTIVFIIRECFNVIVFNVCSARGSL